MLNMRELDKRVKNDTSNFYKISSYEYCEEL